MKFRYISILLLAAFPIEESLMAERVLVEAGEASLHLDSTEPLTFSYQCREGNIEVHGTDAPVVRVELKQEDDDDLPGFLEWDENNRRATLKLLGNAADDDKTFYLPSNSRLKLQSVEGSVRISGIMGDIEISSVEGDVIVKDATASVLIECIDGDIELWNSESESSSPISLMTVDGDITMQIPGNFSGKFEIATLDGRIDFEIPGSVSLNKDKHPGSEWIHKHMQKKAFIVSEGDRRVMLNSVDGDIKILPR